MRGIADWRKVVKLRKNHAVQIVKDPSAVLDVLHADKSLDLVDLIYLPEDKLFYGVPKSHITSTYGQIGLRLKQKKGRQVGFRETLLSSFNEGRLLTVMEELGVGTPFGPHPRAKYTSPTIDLTPMSIVHASLSKPFIS